MNKVVNVGETELAKAKLMAMIVREGIKRLSTLEKMVAAAQLEAVEQLVSAVEAL